MINLLDFPDDHQHQRPRAPIRPRRGGRAGARQRPWPLGRRAQRATRGSTFWLAYRVRLRLNEGRGVRLMVARSSDGVRFEPVLSLTRAYFAAESLERPALVHLGSGRWRLYVSCATYGSKHWWIEALDADEGAESLGQRVPHRSAPTRCGRRAALKVPRGRGGLLDLDRAIEATASRFGDQVVGELRNCGRRTRVSTTHPDGGPWLGPTLDPERAHAPVDSTTSRSASPTGSGWRRWRLTSLDSVRCTPGSTSPRSAGSCRCCTTTPRHEVRFYSVESHTEVNPGSARRRQGNRERRPRGSSGVSSTRRPQHHWRLRAFLRPAASSQ
jgi:hypothetical protein